MVHALVEVAVEDFDTFYSGFETRGFPLRRRHGSRRSQVFRRADDPSQVSILFEWESREAMEGFLEGIKKAERSGRRRSRTSTWPGNSKHEMLRTPCSARDAETR